MGRLFEKLRETWYGSVNRSGIRAAALLAARLGPAGCDGDFEGLEALVGMDFAAFACFTGYGCEGVWDSFAALVDCNADAAGCCAAMASRSVDLPCSFLMVNVGADVVCCLSRLFEIGLKPLVVSNTEGFKEDGAAAVSMTPDDSTLEE
jgi:hypothetical protein